MQITLPPEAQVIIDRKLAAGEYATEEAVILSALVQLETADNFPRVPRALIVPALEQAARGDVLPWTDEVRAEIRRDAVAKMGSGIPVSDNIVY